MNIKTSQDLVDLAKKEITSISAKDAKNLNEIGEITLIDIRDIRELWNEGTIKNSIHIPRGMLEFWLDPESSYYKEKKIGEIKKIGLFCALGMRSALATKSLKEMGFKNIVNVEGGFDSLKNTGLEVVQKEKK
ncbi:rhodanese-like domain-containing protein [Pelagibacteraceae bacterium]|nr:rhodanese-like domain-containing protein [Pelagibacteraceae bacterium]